MKLKLLMPSLATLAVVAGFVFAAGYPTSRAADETPSTGSAGELAGSVKAAGQPIAGATVTLFAAGTAAPAKLAEGKTDDEGVQAGCQQRTQ